MIGTRPLPYKTYSKLAKAIHSVFCDAPQECTYGRETKEMRDNDTEILRQHIDNNHQYGCDCSFRLECYSCQAAVEAENLAARVEINISGKVVIR